MAKLTAAKRKKIPKKEFGMPGERKYPMPDKAQMEHKGKISKSTEAKIDAKADRVLGKKKKK